MTATSVLDKSGYSITANSDKSNYGLSANSLNSVTRTVVTDKTGYSVLGLSSVTAVSIPNATLSSSQPFYAPALASNLGTPVSLDSGLRTIAGMLTKIADNNGGADFKSSTDSLHELQGTVVSGIPLNVKASTG